MTVPGFVFPPFSFFIHIDRDLDLHADEHGQRRKFGKKSVSCLKISHSLLCG